MSTFGSEIRSECFNLAPGTAFCNHGSYGTLPKSVATAQREMRDLAENHPDTFYRETAFKLYEESLVTAAEFLRCSPHDLVFVENVTTGVQAVLSNINLQPDETVLISDHTYNAVANAVKQLAEKVSANVITVKIPLPILSEEHIVEVYQKSIDEHPECKIRLAIFDHISSASAILFPATKLVEMFKSRSIPVLVDGAHAPGQLPLNLDELNPDYYLGNFHKWGYAARGCAILRVHPRLRDTTQALIISHFYKGTLHERFFMQGTRDYTPYLTLPASLKFYHDKGGMEKITSYNSSLIRWAQGLIRDALNTSNLPVPQSMEAPFMACVQLPDDYNGESIRCHELMDLLRKKHNVVVAITEFNEKKWIRISANIYSCKNDFYTVRDALKKLLTT